MLKIKEITKSYVTGDFKQTALDKVSLNFRENEFVAILGPSGSGKTTFLNIIGGLDRYDSGDLIINGTSTSKFEDKDWDAYRNNSIGFIFQSYNLITHLSIVDNVEMGMTLSGVSKDIKKEKAIEALTKVGLKDHIHKKPNQLSGGQMQRVAIARALANNPDIILADEPTGALDTKTSIQIMELIKEIAEDKLVIMVTHNPDLAKDYADRIVDFKDGKVVSDTNPAKDENVSTDYELKKTSMSFFTALKLSGKNIATKKGRTALTAFASSIGIIGIALILSLSNGFDKQINDFESSTLSGFPITITKSNMEVDMETMTEHRNEVLGLTQDDSKYPEEKVLYPKDPLEKNMIHENKFTNEYINYVENIDKTYLSGISYTRIANMNMLRSGNEGITAVNTSAVNFAVYPSNLKDSENNYLKNNYDLLEGEYPKNMTDLILVVDEYNRIDKNILKELGFNDEAEKLDLKDLVGKEFKIIMNDDYYTKAGPVFVTNSSKENLEKIYNSSNSVTVKISGVIRANKDNKLSVLSPGISYSDDLSKYFIENAKNSKVVKEQLEVDYNILTGQTFKDTTAVVPSSNPMQMMQQMQGTGQMPSTKESMLQVLGGEGTPNLITLYPTDFKSKENVMNYLNEWNKDKDESNQIIVQDLASTFTDLSGGIMDAITMVLIAFASISLVVSLIMVGIITYISVLERRKEIGVLRALGARKKDITRVFNAETFIIGSCSGILGILIAYSLTFPINVVLEEVTDLVNVAVLNPVHAISLIAISITLTILGGFIPAKIAAKKDPVEALRSE